MTEAEFKGHVIKLARSLGHLVFSIPDSRRMQGDPGFPDLCIAGNHSVLFVELKDGGGNRSANQVTWHYKLIAAGQRSTLWRPRDFAYIKSILEEL